MRNFLSFNGQLQPRVIDRGIILFTAVVATSCTGFTLGSSFILGRHVISRGSFRFASKFVCQGTHSGSSLTVDSSVTSFASSLFDKQVSSGSLVKASVFLWLAVSGKRLAVSGSFLVWLTVNGYSLSVDWAHFLWCLSSRLSSPSQRPMPTIKWG